MKNLISIDELSKEDIDKIMKITDEIKDKIFPRTGKSAALLFNRPSTRTLVSFEAALEQIGMGAIHLDYVFTQMIKGEAVRDTAKTFGQYVSLVVARLLPHSMLEEFAQHSTVPVINAGTDYEHPCQALGDLYTLRLYGRKKPRIVFVGDPSNAIANSFATLEKKGFLTLQFLAPPGYKSRSSPVSNDASIAKDADVIYTTHWIKENEDENERTRDFIPYQVNEAMANLAPKALIMHSLPAFRGMEISDGVLDNKNSIVWQQAKNKLYIEKAIMKFLEV